MWTYLDAVKKALAVLTCACLTLTLLPVAALAQAGDEFATITTDDVVDGGACGDGLTWTLTGTEEEGYTLTISGTGDMWDFEDSHTGSIARLSEPIVGEPGWYDYAEQIDTVEIGDAVTSIGTLAFWKCSRLTSISVPDGVQSIGASAFFMCYSLEYISLGSSVSFLDELAFGDANAMKAFSVSPENPYFCSEDGVLFDKEQTSLIKYPAMKEETSYVVPETVTTLEYSAFYESAVLESVVLPDSLTSMASGVFSASVALRTIVLPDALTELPAATFAYCNALEDVTIGSGVTSIGRRAFIRCRALSHITLPAGVSDIGSEAFDGCSNLSSITIGSALTSIDTRAFGECEMLSDVYYAGTKDQWDSIEIGLRNTLLLDATIHYLWPAEGAVVDSGACGDDLTWTLVGAEGAGYTLYIDGTGEMWDCQDYSGATAGVVMPDGKPAASFGKSPWDDCRQGITGAVVGEGVTSIGSHAFYGHSALKAVVLADSVTTIEKSAFEGCSALTNISIPDGVREIDQCAFRYCSSLESMTIPDGVTSLGGCLFSYCSALETVTIGDGADRIEYGFYDCTSLRSVYIGSGVEDIDLSFQLCTALESIEVSPDNPCFASADGVLFDKGQTKLIKYPLAKEGGSYTVPDTVVSIDDRAFSSSLDVCDNLPWVGNPFLESVALPNGTATIGKGAFAGCDALKELTCGAALAEVGWLAFYGCDALTDVYYAGTEEQWAAIEIDSNNDSLFNATIHYNWVIETPDPGDGNPDAGNPEGPNPDPKVAPTHHPTAASVAAQSIRLAKHKVSVTAGKRTAVKVKGAKTRLSVKVSKKARKALEVKVKGKKKLVVKAKASAKSGTYKIKVWAKKDAGYAKSAKKVLKVKVA